MRALILSLAFATPLLAQAPPLRIRTDTGEGATLLAATFLGGSGHEWLCGGGFLADGSIVVVGNIIGPDAGAAKDVIGTDTAAPPAAERIPELDKGKPKLDKQGQPVFEKPSWRHAGVTAFVAHVSADLKTVTSIKRFPWAVGAATAAAVAPNGDVYIAGRALPGIEKLGVTPVELQTTSAGKGTCDHAFLVKIAADGKPLWLRTVKGPVAAPTVTLAGAKVLFAAGSLFTLDAEGKTLSTVEVPGGMKTTSSVSPKDGSIAVGGEHHWPTGREPWRCPTLNIHNADGTRKHQFYDWGGPYVGLDNLRQVSDSAIRYLTHDADGSILFYAWSDGGNSVMTTEPFDVRTQVKHKGIGMTAAGAGVLSAAYIIRLDPNDYHVTAWTFWSATVGPTNKPNSIWLQTLASAPDGCVAIAGMGANQIWQTPEKLSDAPANGEYLSIFSKDLSTLRFSTVVPGAGIAVVNDGASDRGGQWAIATGTVSGKCRVLFLGSAAAGKKDGEVDVPTPTRNAGQAKFGGGWCDGYAVLVELPPAVEKTTTAVARTPGPTKASFALGAPARNMKKNGDHLPADGTIFRFSATTPKHVTVDVEARDQTDQLWPNFFSGKPVEGALTVKGGKLEGKVQVATTALCQPEDLPTRHILGELVTDPKMPPSVRFTLETLGEMKTEEVTYDDKGKEKVKQLDYREASGVLEIGNAKLAVKPRVSVVYSTAKDGKIDGVRFSAFLTLTAAELKLKAPSPETKIDLRITASGVVAK